MDLKHRGSVVFVSLNVFMILLDIFESLRFASWGSHCLGSARLPLEQIPASSHRGFTKLPENPAVGPWAGYQRQDDPYCGLELSAWMVARTMAEAWAKACLSPCVNVEMSMPPT
jgi:hypothetical protein